MKTVIFLLILLVLFSGCTQQSSEKPTIDTQSVIGFCIELCNSVKSTTDMSDGPCLSDNNPNWNVNDVVCDVAHSPRQNVDDLKENQCSDFREGKAHRFIEVDTNCNLIRVV